MNDVIDQATRILRGKSIEGYEIYLNESIHFEVESKEGKIESLETSRYLGVAFRIINHQRMGFSYSTFLDPSPSAAEPTSGGLDRMINNAIRGAEATTPDRCLDFAPPLGTSPSPPAIFDETLDGIPEKEKIEKAKHLEESARSVDPDRVKKVRKASYQDVVSRTTLINSNGLQFSYNQTLAFVNVTAVAEESGTIFFHGHTVANVAIRPAQVSRIGQNRIDHQRLALVIGGDFESNLVSSKKFVAAVDQC